MKGVMWHHGLEARTSSLTSDSSHPASLYISLAIPLYPKPDPKAIDQTPVRGFPFIAPYPDFPIGQHTRSQLFPLDKGPSRKRTIPPYLNSIDRLCLEPARNYPWLLVSQKYACRIVCPSVSIFQLKWGWVLSIATGFSKFSQRRSFKRILRPDSQPDISNNRVTK